MGSAQGHVQHPSGNQRVPVIDGVNRFIDTRVEYLVDDGAGATRYIHTRRRDALEHLKGVAEETTSGVRPLRVMAADGALKVPALAVNDASSKQLFDNVYGTGASVITTLLDVTNMQMQGKSMVVVSAPHTTRTHSIFVTIQLIILSRLF